ncbi:VWA domain-containing protein [Fusobacterium polymorphum]|uniref:VWA domain-containing protein n=1 Tax=Fusobacterium nucleatum subsp. polymorphum TaxID=76857 RepID=A0A2B7YN96_FUSNP|nr:VWA domain-containing protein [Fusobacterium polymorphum]PGH22765.1 hypothetical protein RN96_06625 [Fusobacterium polymorphum]PHI09741.1 hypothetical protein CBG52_00465 [Fusobacterium polymorphum]
MDIKEDIKRWRLILGKDTEEDFSSMDSEAISSFSEEDWLMDRALDAIYNPTGKFMSGEVGAGAGKGPSNPQISRWLGDIRNLFDKELVKIIQTDAMDRCGLKQLIFEPEILEQVEPDINLASTIMLLKEQIPQKSKESVRAFIKKIVEEINKLLESDIKRAVRAALNKRQHSPIPSASSLDFKTTIQRGIKNYNKELKKIIPEHYYFFERSSTNPTSKFTVILDIDQSGSMGESVIYSSVMSCILASMAALKTRIVAFDTEIVDLTEKSDDPVDLLYGFQLGGGTDINKSIKYCMKYIENPKKTIFFLISDLMEGGNRGGMLRNLEDMKESGVTVVCLLAISGDGQPYYDAQMAGKIASMGIPCFACNPEKLPLLLERVLKNLDLSSFQEEFKKKK